MENLEDGYYNTNLGVLYYNQIFFNPREYSAWEPVVQEEVTQWEYIKPMRKYVACKWVSTGYQSYQLQTGLWWVACIRKSDNHPDLYFYKYLSCDSPIEGYASTMYDAKDIVNKLVLTHSKYHYIIDK